MNLPSQFHNADDELVEYDGSPLSWRVSIYALIVHEKKILILKNRNEKLCDIPGGGIELDETLQQALQRECLEEAGAQVTIGNLVYLTEDYFYHSTQKAFYKTLQLFYRGTLKGKLTTPTENTTEWVKWVSFEEVPTTPLPQAVKKAIELISV